MCIIARQEGKKMKTKLRILAAALVAGSTMFAGPRLSVGIAAGGYVPPAYVQYQPPCPGPGYVWVNGVWRAPVVVERHVDRDHRDFRHDDHDRGFRR